MSKYVNPYTDFGFKKLFGEEANKELLIDFLNQMLPERHQIADLAFQNVENLPDTSEERKALIPQILNEPIFERAFQTAEVANFSPKQREEYEKSKLVYFEVKAVSDTAKEEGRMEGREEGRTERNIEIARNMKSKGLSIQDISEITGLSADVIQQL